MAIDYEETRRLFTAVVVTCKGRTSTASEKREDVLGFLQDVAETHRAECTDKNEKTGLCRRLSLNSNVFDETITPNFG